MTDTSKEPPELLPCPFCGGDAGDTYYQLGWFISCKHCSASTEVTNAKARAVEAWNRRAPAVPVWYVPVTASIGTVQRAMEDGWNKCVDAMLAAAPQPPEADHIPDAGKMDTNVRNWMNAALSKDVACPACGLSGLHACPSASTAESQGADAVKALEKVLRAVQRHLPPERIGERETIAEIISIVDPWPLGKPPAPWKDHMTAELVGKLTDVARQFHGTQQLRERIAGLVRPVCERIKQFDGDRMPEVDMGNPISAAAPAQLPEIDIDTANHAGIRVRGYTQETVRQLLADQQFKLDELAMLTRMVVHAFRQVAPDNKTAAKTVDYLKRKGLAGNPLRAAQEQST